MDPIQLPEDIASLAAEALTELSSAARAAFDAILEAETPTSDQVTEAERLASIVDTCDTEFARRQQEVEENAARVNALRTKFTATEPETPVEPEPAAVEPPAAPAPVTAAAPAPAPSAVDVLAPQTPRPATPRKADLITITAAADVPEISAGSRLVGIEGLTTAIINRSKAWPRPLGTSHGQMDHDIRTFGTASITKAFPEDLIIKNGQDVDEVLRVIEYAAKETRLEGGSLTAAAGWCSPSEVMYDLCDGETLDGILSIPEVQVNRGGMKYTSGPMFADFYGSSAFFEQTEAQAIAGTAKSCFEIPCPTFTDVRLDAKGVCLTFPILLNSSYPELVQRWVRGVLTAHEHKVNAYVIGKIVAALGAARAQTDMLSTAQSTLASLELIGDQLRQKYRLGLKQTLEVVAPQWLLGAIRNDLALRMGVGLEVVTDQMITAHFAARKVNVQWVYEYQDLTLTDNAYPATAEILVYPAGTFVKGTAPVISLQNVYDAASLNVNTFTGLFTEEGILVAQNCYTGARLTIAVCNSGKQGLSTTSVCNVVV